MGGGVKACVKEEVKGGRKEAIWRKSVRMNEKGRMVGKRRQPRKDPGCKDEKVGRKEGWEKRRKRWRNVTGLEVRCSGGVV